MQQPVIKCLATLSRARSKHISYLHYCLQLWNSNCLSLHNHEQINTTILFIAPIGYQAFESFFISPVLRFLEVKLTCWKKGHFFFRDSRHLLAKILFLLETAWSFFTMSRRISIKVHLCKKGAYEKPFFFYILFTQES